MTSDRMIQAIGRIERAITRLENFVETKRDQSRSRAEEVARLTAALAAAHEDKAALETRLSAAEAAAIAARDATQVKQPSLPLAGDERHDMNPFSHDKALAALRSLDALIEDLQKARGDG